MPLAAREATDEELKKHLSEDASRPSYALQKLSSALYNPDKISGESMFLPAVLNDSLCVQRLTKNCSPAAVFNSAAAKQQTPIIGTFIKSFEIGMAACSEITDVFRAY